jgi:hypothetical protein
MDPQAAIKELLESLHNGDKLEIVNNLENLTNWIVGGGFLPIIYKDVMNSLYHGNPPVKQFENTQVIVPTEVWIIPEKL